MDEVVAGRDTADVVASDRGTWVTEFDEFVASTGSALLRTAYLLTGDHASAEDLLQDTLVRLVPVVPGTGGRPAAGVRPARARDHLGEQVVGRAQPYRPRAPGG